MPSSAAVRRPKNAADFQTIIAKLQRFWAARDCVILQPLDMEVGAGTFHPATFLRAVGPEPWRAAFVQPSRRPQDGRYGDNPNRLQHYHQFQTVMKPPPPDFQNLFLRSLGALGIARGENDIRFVEDNWESPTLGAWGSGWEVWLNGAEVAQFTYFQQVGGLAASPPTGEITYGLERLAMFLQGVDSVFDIRWRGDITYRDLWLQNEREQSAYNFDIADAGFLARAFDDCEKQSVALIDNEIVLPGYEMAMKCSHFFNLLDARGVISASERVGYVARVRTLTKQCAQLYYNSRENIGFPLCQK